MLSDVGHGQHAVSRGASLALLTSNAGSTRKEGYNHVMAKHQSVSRLLWAVRSRRALLDLIARTMGFIRSQAPGCLGNVEGVIGTSCCQARQ